MRTIKAISGHLLVWAIAAGVAVLLSGCSTLSERAATSTIRHPCGNVWDVCEGDNPWLLVVDNVLTGKN